MGLRHPELYEIGKPVSVITAPTIIVKAELYRGSGPVAEQANLVWSSMTELTPPILWDLITSGARQMRVW